jgi:hypothetical protein
MLKKLTLAAVLVFLAVQPAKADPWCSSVAGQQCSAPPTTLITCVNDSSGWIETCDCLQGRWMCTS